MPKDTPSAKHKQEQKRQKTSSSKDKGTTKKDPRLERAGVSGYNQPKRTPNHPTKYGIVVAKKGNVVKTIRFGEQGTETNKTEEQRQRFKSRHQKNINNKLSGAYWSNKVRWDPKKTKSKKNKDKK